MRAALTMRHYVTAKKMQLVYSCVESHSKRKPFNRCHVVLTYFRPEF